MSLARLLMLGLTAAVSLSPLVRVEGASAATFSYVGTTSVSPYLNSGGYTFPAVLLPKFDIPGMCLSSVCVRLDGHTTGFASFENYDNFPKVVNVTWSAKFDLLRPSLAPLLTVSPTVTTSDPVTSFDGNLDYAGTSGITHSGLGADAADSLCLSTPADLALFSGPGTISLPCKAADVSFQTGANSWSFGLLGVADIKVMYTYEECATPVAPMTWGRLKTTYR